MQIKEIFVRNLFGLYTYQIDFRLGESPLTLITGPNGYGKTTILKMVSNLNVSNLYYFYKLRYDLIRVAFSDDSCLEIEQQMVADRQHEGIENRLDTKMAQSKNVRFAWIRNEETVASFVYNEEEIHKGFKRLRYRASLLSSKIAHEILLENWTSNLLEKYLLSSELFNNILATNQKQDGFLMQLQSIRTTFIPANRIYKETQSKDEELPIERVVEKMKENLEKARMRYVDESLSDDALFVKEILADTGREILEDEYAEKSRLLQELANRFSTYVPIKIEIPDYKAKNSAILSYYLNRLERKLKNCNDVIDKVSLFDEMLKSKRFSSKKVNFSPQHGIRVETSAGEFIDVTMLSSGEQNEIVLLYKLIFEVADRSILLVDEPENSLHVAWQKMIVSDLNRIADVKRLQLIIATHSPVIVSHGRRFATDLYYIQENKK